MQTPGVAVPVSEVDFEIERAIMGAKLGATTHYEPGTPLYYATLELNQAAAVEALKNDSTLLSNLEEAGLRDALRAQAAANIPESDPASDQGLISSSLVADVAPSGAQAADVLARAKPTSPVPLLMLGAAVWYFYFRRK